MNDCIFCKIVAGEIPSYKVYEDNHVLAFLDISPVNPGHTMVVPKQHVDEFQDMDRQLYDQVMTVVQTLAKKIKQNFNPERVGLMVYGYGVSHAHVHVIPMHGPKDMPQPTQTEASKAELEATAAKLRP